jgi:translation initiation factor eIF-2B subunit alpha
MTNSTTLPIHSSNPANSSLGTNDGFDIVSEYQQLLASDPTITMPLAAIRALLKALSVHPTTTVAETLDYLQSQVNLLTISSPNHLSLSAGTDLFTRYIIRLISDAGAEADFRIIRAKLLASGAHFAETARLSRDMVARQGRTIVGESNTILTLGGSRTVAAVLTEAAKLTKGPVKWKVLYILPDLDGAPKKCEGWDMVETLRSQDIPVATVSLASVAHLLGEKRVDVVLVGAEAVVGNGGVISRMGTALVAWIAKDKRVPFYVAAESQKFVRMFPAGNYEVPLRQDVVEYFVVEEGQVVKVDDDARYTRKDQLPINNKDEFVDYTVSFYHFSHHLLTQIAP